MKARPRPAFQSALIPHHAGHGAVEYTSRERRRTLPWQEIFLLGALIGLVSLAYVLLTAESAPAPMLSILSPAPDAAVTGGTVAVFVRALHVEELVGKQGCHFHYYLDAEPPTAPNRPALTAAASCFSTSETSHTWRLAGSGWHRLSVQLVRGNDAPLSPAVLATVNVRVPATTSASAGGPGSAAGGGTPSTAPSTPTSGGGC